MNQFNQLYDLHWIGKCIENVDAICYKLKPASKRVTKNRLKNASKQRPKKEKLKKKQKLEAMTAKQNRARRGISSINKENDENDTKNITNPDQDQQKYPL